LDVWIAAGAAVGVGAALVGGYVGVVTGALAIDLGPGRRTPALGPRTVEIGAPWEEVFDVIAAGYLARQPKAVAGRFGCSSVARDMVLAAHRTPVHGVLVATRSRRTVSRGRSGWTSGWSVGRCRTSSSGSP
jgi:hypothetical protein